MTYLKKISEHNNSKNKIIECHQEITFNQVTLYIKQIKANINTACFEKDYVFYKVDDFFNFTGKLEKEKDTEQFFILFFRNQMEFLEIITNKSINLEELNKKGIFFLLIIPNNFKGISQEENYHNFEHLYINKYMPKELKDLDILEKSGFGELSEFNQIEILKDFNLTSQEIQELEFKRVVSNDVSRYYQKNIMAKKILDFTRIKNKLLTIF